MVQIIIRNQNGKKYFEVAAKVSVKGMKTKRVKFTLFCPIFSLLYKHKNTSSSLFKILDTILYTKEKSSQRS